MKAPVRFEFDRRDRGDDENDLACFGYFAELKLKDLDKARRNLLEKNESLRNFVSINLRWKHKKRGGCQNRLR
jgi:hypothetical protein